MELISSSQQPSKGPGIFPRGWLRPVTVSVAAGIVAGILVLILAAPHAPSAGAGPTVLSGPNLSQVGQGHASEGVVSAAPAPPWSSGTSMRLGEMALVILVTVEVWLLLRPRAGSIPKKLDAQAREAVSRRLRDFVEIQPGDAGSIHLLRTTGRHA